MREFLTGRLPGPRLIRLTQAPRHEREDMRSLLCASSWRATSPALVKSQAWLLGRLFERWRAFFGENRGNWANFTELTQKSHEINGIYMGLLLQSPDFPLTLKGETSIHRLNSDISYTDHSNIERRFQDGDTKDRHTAHPHCATHLSPPLRAEDGAKTGTAPHPACRGASEPTPECVTVPKQKRKQRRQG